MRTPGRGPGTHREIVLVWSNSKRIDFMMRQRSYTKSPLSGITLVGRQDLEVRHILRTISPRGRTVGIYCNAPGY
jgi:hypothetical protein